MYTTQDERGILNNYATEPKMYFAAYPSLEQQRRYMLIGGLAVVLVTSLFAIAIGVS
jgi:hypothetical protein